MHQHHAQSPHASRAAAPLPPSIAAPASARAGQAREDQGLHRRRRQGGVLLPAADHRRAARLLQGRRPGRRDLRLRRRRARAAGAWWAARPTSCSGAYEHTINLQAKNQYHPVLRAAGPRAADRDGRVDQGHARLHAASPTCAARRSACPRRARRPTWWPTWCCRARGLKASDVSFVGVGTSAGALAALRSGPDRRHEQHRPGDDHAGAEGRREDHQRHAHAQGHAGGVRRPDAGGLPLRADASSCRSNPNTCQALANAIVHGLKWLQTAGPSDIIKTVPEGLPARRPRAVPGVLQQGARGDRRSTACCRTRAPGPR